MLAGGVALTPTYASYNKQQLAITKLAIKSVARLTKIAHWAERQFDFEVFFFVFRSVSFCFLFASFLFAVSVLLPLLSACSFGTQVVHTRCRRRLSTVRHADRARWLRSYSNEMFAPAITSSAWTTAFFFDVSLFRFFPSAFSVLFSVLIAPRNAEIFYAENRENLWKLLWQRVRFSLSIYSLSLVDGDSQKCFPKYFAWSSCSTVRDRAKARDRARARA